MNMADPDAPDATDVAPAEAPPSPSSPSGAPGTSGNRQAPSADGVAEAGVPRGCPFLLAESGGWRLNAPARDHRCTAVTPAAALSLEKQARLCLTAAHTSCATYVASVSARGDRIGTTRVTGQATRWALTRTTTVIEDAGGLRSRVLGLVLDRGRWPAIPAVILVATLIVLAISGLQGGGTTPAATTSPTHLPTAAPTSRPTVVPTATPEPQATPTAVPPSAAPSPTPVKTAKPTPTFRTYRVKSGDTLSGIASHFGTTSFAIAALNGIAVDSILRVGQVLKIPNP